VRRQTRLAAASGRGAPAAADALRFPVEAFTCAFNIECFALGRPVALPAVDLPGAAIARCALVEDLDRVDADRPAVRFLVLIIVSSF
jgi:hypothetical protein